MPKEENNLLYVLYIQRARKRGDYSIERHAFFASSVKYENAWLLIVMLCMCISTGGVTKFTLHNSLASIDPMGPIATMLRFNRIFTVVCSVIILDTSDSASATQQIMA
jgi:hypothetical protein